MTMIFQLALDRFSIEEALQMARNCQEEADWIEIGTSLIKEFGMESVLAFREAFPQKFLLADTKTIDKETVDMMNNFDDTLQEPSVMPTKIPNLLVNGGNGIAVCLQSL